MWYINEYGVIFKIKRAQVTPAGYPDVPKTAP